MLDHSPIALAATAFMVPGVVFGLFVISNTVLWAEGSSNHVNFVTMLSLIGLWFLVSVPFTFFGSYLAFKKPVRAWAA
jgi:transmembrane 9 superfamily protein 2/4